MSFSPDHWLVRLWGLHSCESLEEKIFSCCSNSLMGFPHHGNPSEYSRVLASLPAHDRRSEQGNLCVVFTNLCYQLGSGASSLCSLKLGPHSLSGLLHKCLFHSYGNYISQDFPNLNRLHFRYLNPKGKVWCPFNQAQPTPNGSCRDFPGGSEIPCRGPGFDPWSGN